MAPGKKKTTNSNRRIKALRQKDCLFGRGGGSNNHPGNHRYQKVIEQHSAEYARCTLRKDKTRLSWKILDDLRREGVRFLKKHKPTARYYEASDEEVRKKISQRLRELALLIKLSAGSKKGENLDAKKDDPSDQDPAAQIVEKIEDDMEPLDPQGHASHFDVDAGVLLRHLPPPLPLTAVTVHMSQLSIMPSWAGFPVAHQAPWVQPFPSLQPPLVPSHLPSQSVDAMLRADVIEDDSDDRSWAMVSLDSEDVDLRMDELDVDCCFGV